MGALAKAKDVWAARKKRRIADTQLEPGEAVGMDVVNMTVSICNLILFG